MGLEQLAL